MPLTFEQETFLWEIQEAEPGSEEEKNALAFIRDNSIEFEDDEFYWTPLITAISRKRPSITEALLAKKADIYYVARSGTTALSAAIRVQDQGMIDFLTPRYKARFGEDRIILDQLTALIDNYYPTDHINEKESIRNYRAYMMPILQGYRLQPTPLNQATLEFLGKEIAEFQAWIRERDLAIQKQQIMASYYKDEKEREAFLKMDEAAYQEELKAQNQARRERIRLEQQLKEEQAKRLELEAKQKAYEAAQRKAEEAHQALASRQAEVEVEVAGVAKEVKSVGARVGSLWQAHETVLDMKAEQVFIRGQGALRVFYGQVQGKLNDLFVGRSAARSGELVVQDGGAGKVSSAINLAGDLLPFPGAKLVTGVVAAAAGFYVKYRKGQQDKRIDQGLGAVASGVVEWETHISEPSARSLTLLGDQPIRRFGEQEARQLGEIAVRLMLVWIVLEYPKLSPPPDYEEIIHHLLLAVRVQRAGKLKDIHGKTIQPKLLVTLSGERLAEDKIFAAFSEQRPRIEQPAPKHAPPTPLRSASPTPLPSGQLASHSSRAVTPQPPLLSRSVSPPPPPLPRVVGVASPVTAASLAPSRHLAPVPLPSPQSSAAASQRQGQQAKLPSSGLSLTLVD